MVITLTAGQQGSSQPKNNPTMSSFPELIWIQQESPQDDLAQASQEIRKLGQKSLDHMKPIKQEDEVDLEAGKVVEANKRVPIGSKKEDDITQLVENEYISLFIENVLCAEFSMLSLNPKSEEVPRSTRRTFVPDILLKKQLMSSLANGDKKEAFQPLFSTPTQEIKSSRLKETSAQKENSGTEYANTEINRILKLLEKSTVQENLNTNTKGNINASINCDDGEKLKNEKKEFPAFSNLCSKTGVDEVWHQVNSEYWQSLEKASKEEIPNQNVKGFVKTDVTLPQAEIKKRKCFFSKAPGAKIDVKSEPGDDHNDLQDCQSLIKISDESELLSREGECGFHETHFSFPHADVGTYKLFSPDSPFSVPLIKTPSTPRPYGDPKAKTSTSTTVAVMPTFKNNLYCYSTPALRHYPSSVAVRPLIPPYFHTFMTPTNSFYQYRPCYQTPLQQIPPKYLALNHNTHLRGFSRQRVPFSPFPVGQPLFSARHNPMMTYTPFMHAYYGWRPHIVPVTRNLPPVAAEGPRYMLAHLFRYCVPPLTRPVLNYPYFTSRGNGTKPI